MKRLICLILIGMLGYLCVEAKDFKGHYYTDVIDAYGEPMNEYNPQKARYIGWLKYSGEDCGITFYVDSDGYIDAIHVKKRSGFQY